MSKCTYDSIVSNNEIEALKEMIFQRAKERAENMTKDVNSNYTESMKNDIMNMARSSFNTGKNPFAANIEKETQTKDINEQKTETPQTQVNNTDFINDTKIEASKLRIKNLKSQIYNNRENTNNEILKTTLNTTMDEARQSLNKKQTFMDALNFLNSQASLSLIESRATIFEAVA